MVMVVGARAGLPAVGAVIGPAGAAAVALQVAGHGQPRRSAAPAARQRPRTVVQIEAVDVHSDPHLGNVALHRIWRGGRPRCVISGTMSSLRGSGARFSRLAGAGTGLVLLGGLLTACSSGPVPQTTASAYLSAWARQDWTAMRQLADNPPARLRGGEHGGVHRPGREQGHLHRGHDEDDRVDGAGAGHRAARADRPRHGHDQADAAPGAALRALAGRVDTGDDRAAAAGRRPAHGDHDVAGPRGDRRRGRRAADQPGAAGDHRRRGQPGQGRHLADVRAGRGGRDRAAGEHRDHRREGAPDVLRAGLHRAAGALRAAQADPLPDPGHRVRGVDGAAGDHPGAHRGSRRDARADHRPGAEVARRRLQRAERRRPERAGGGRRAPAGRARPAATVAVVTAKGAHVATLATLPGHAGHRRADHDRPERAARRGGRAVR